MLFCSTRWRCYLAFRRICVRAYCAVRAPWCEWLLWQNRASYLDGSFCSILPPLKRKGQHRSAKVSKGQNVLWSCTTYVHECTGVRDGKLLTIEHQYHLPVHGRMFSCFTNVQLNLCSQNSSHHGFRSFLNGFRLKVRCERQTFPRIHCATYHCQTYYKTVFPALFLHLPRTYIKPNYSFFIIRAK